jgi:hypothetical protein
VVLVIDAADAAQLVGSGLVIQVADQGVTGVGGHCQDATFFEQRHRLLEQADLRVIGMNSEVLSHGPIVPESAGLFVGADALGRLRRLECDRSTGPTPA